VTGPNAHVFVSYSSLDGRTAEALDTHLHTVGVTCWRAPRDITAGVDWGEAIVDAISNSAALVVILSSNSVQTPHVRRELALARDAEIPIVAFRIDGVRLPQAIDYYIGRAGWVSPPSEPFEQQLSAVGDEIIRTLARRSHDQVSRAVGAEPIDRSHVDRWLLLALRLFTWVGAFGLLSESLMLVNPADDFSESDAAQFLLVFLPAHVGLGAAAAVLFLDWFATTHARLEALGAPVTTGRRESIAPGFLVPFRNAFTAPGLLRNLWQASAPPPGVPERLKAMDFAWWILALVGTGFYTYLAFAASDPDELLPVAWQSLAGTAALVGAARGARRFVKAVDGRMHGLDRPLHSPHHHDAT
jgi:hypothetical protein